jgi:threonine dehydrogenase-like Zn-dependent dehydrogenase
MKVLQVRQPNAFELVELPMPGLQNTPLERILVKTAWVSLCGSDIPFFTGNKRHVKYPLPPGAPIHESVGQVVESQSSQFRPGDMVLAIPEGDQGLAEYFVAQAAKAIPLPVELAGCDDSCLIQPLSTVVNGVDQLGDLRGKSVAVVGLGSIGLFFCWLLRQRGAGRVLGIDPNPFRCQVAESLGADRTWALRSVEVIHAARQEMGGWPPLDIVIEAVGHQSETINDCLELVRWQGTVLAFGVPDQHVYAIEYEKFFRKNAVMIAVVTPDWSDYLGRAGKLYLANRQTLSRLVTHRLPIIEAGKAFSLYAQHADNILKVILDAADWG